MLTLDVFQANPTTTLTEPPALTLRIWYNQRFLDVDGETVLPGPKDFYIACACSIAANVITVAATDIFTTLDANVQNPQSIQCSGQFFSGNTAKDWLFSQWVIPSEAEYPGGVITFEQLTIYNTGANTLANPPSTYLTEAQTIAYFSTLSPAQDASATIKGITKLSVAPASATNPIAYGANDTNVATSTTVSQNSSVAGSAATSNSTNISATGSRVTSNSIIISVADSKAVSDSVVISSLTTTTNSRVTSNSSNISVADSKAVSDSVLASTADSKGVSAGLGASTADSKALSNSTNISVSGSQNTSQSLLVSIADSKALSGSVVTSTLTTTSNSKVASVSLNLSTTTSTANSG